jgi:hypothetical protein
MHVKKGLNQKGSAMVMTVVVLTMIIGMSALVIDVGSVMIEKHRLRNAVDAAVLAGGQELPMYPDVARSIAAEYAEANGAVAGRILVDIDEDSCGIRVTAEQTVDYKFASVFGLSTKDVVQSSYAKLGVAGSVYNGIRPFAVEWGDFDYGESVTLKEGGGDGETGNYGAVALGLRGANSFMDNLKFGYNGKLSVGDLIDTEPGNMSGPTIDGINYILGNDNSTFENFSKTSLRIWIIPVVDSFDALGRDQIEVSGFAAFFVENTQNVDGDAVVVGRFMEYVTNADIDVAVNNYGASGLKLMQ